MPGEHRSKHWRRAQHGFVNRWVLVLVCIVVAGWWFSRPSTNGKGVAQNGDASSDCPLPPQVAAGDEPLQTSVPAGLKPFSTKAATLQPLAGFSVDARVLARENYSLDRESALSPTDLALGWKRMADSNVYSQLGISQSSRWYHYRWSGEPPLPPPEIIVSSANMHMIPATDAVANELAKVGRDEHVRIDGWLVEASAPDGWRWRSSTTRDDVGAHACEVVYVCAINRLTNN